MRRTRTASLILILGILVSAMLAPQHAKAAAAYVISDNTTGVVLDSVNGDKKLQIGSLTKIAMAMVVLDWQASTSADLSELATVPNYPPALSSTAGVGFQSGDQCSLRDLLYAALMQSDNVASETLAFHVGKSLGNGGKLPPVERFVQQMNALAKSKGMLRTRFLNAHGLDTLERSLPFSTAEDCAKLAAYAMSNSAFRFYVSQKERKIATVPVAGGPGGYMLRNTNELVGVNGIDGVKTGTTRKAGQCLIISAAKAPESVQKGETHFITPRRINVVVLGSNDRFTESANLLARGWQLHDSWAAAGRPREDGKGRR